MVWPVSIKPQIAAQEALLKDARAAKLSAESSFENILWDVALDEEFGADANVIYVIEQLGGTPAETFAAFKKAKGKALPPGLPRANAASNILYVGSSHGRIKSRLSEHLSGNCAGGTYALKLGKWFVACQYKVHLRRYCVDKSSGLLQIIEDCISSELKPAFGKQGNNGR